MAFGVLKLSRKGREILDWIFIILSVLLAIISFTLVLSSIYITILTAQALYSEKDTLCLVFTMIGTIGVQLTIFYTVGIYISRYYHNNAHKKSSKCMSRIWVFCGYGYLISALLISSKAAAVSNDLVRSMHHSMTRGMRSYLTHLKWKKVIDTLQFKMQCCGSYGYSDWHETPWLYKWHFSNFNESIGSKYRISGSHVYIPAVPWSCCKLDYAKQCLHDPVQQYQSHNIWDDVALLTINHDGCVDMIRQPVETAFLVFILLTVSLLILQVLQSIISRYLYTSFRNSVLLGDPGGAAPGWLFDWSTFGFQKGTTVSQIMFGKNRAREQVPLPSEPDTNDRTSEVEETTLYETDYSTPRTGYSDIEEEERLLMK